MVILIGFVLATFLLLLPQRWPAFPCTSCSKPQRTAASLLMIPAADRLKNLVIAAAVAAMVAHHQNSPSVIGAQRLDGFAKVGVALTPATYGIMETVAVYGLMF